VLSPSTKPKVGCDDPLDRRGRQAALLLLRPTIAALSSRTTSRAAAANNCCATTIDTPTASEQDLHLQRGLQHENSTLSHPHQYCVPNCLVEVRQQVLRFKSICSQRIVRTTTKPTTASGDLFIVFIYKLYKHRNSCSHQTKEEEERNPRKSETKLFSVVTVLFHYTNNKQKILPSLHFHDEFEPIIAALGPTLFPFRRDKPLLPNLIRVEYNAVPNAISVLNHLQLQSQQACSERR
jgi:hypothetical protein